MAKQVFDDEAAELASSSGECDHSGVWWLWDGG
jgi:hypothetical protein